MLALLCERHLTLAWQNRGMAPSPPLFGPKLENHPARRPASSHLGARTSRHPPLAGAPIRWPRRALPRRTRRPVGPAAATRADARLHRRRATAGPCLANGRAHLHRGRLRLRRRQRLRAGPARLAPAGPTAGLEPRRLLGARPRARRLWPDARHRHARARQWGRRAGDGGQRHRQRRRRGARARPGPASADHRPPPARRDRRQRGAAPRLRHRQPQPARLRLREQGAGRGRGDVLCAAGAARRAARARFVWRQQPAAPRPAAAAGGAGHGGRRGAARRPQPALGGAGPQAHPQRADARRSGGAV